MGEHPYILEISQYLFFSGLAVSRDKRQSKYSKMIIAVGFRNQMKAWMFFVLFFLLFLILKASHNKTVRRKQNTQCEMFHCLLSPSRCRRGTHPLASGEVGSRLPAGAVSALTLLGGAEAAGGAPQRAQETPWRWASAWPPGSGRK